MGKLFLIRLFDFKEKETNRTTIQSEKLCVLELLLNEQEFLERVSLFLKLQTLCKHFYSTSSSFFSLYSQFIT